jgi:hypothetical protein
MDRMEALTSALDEEEWKLRVPADLSLYSLDRRFGGI